MNSADKAWQTRRHKELQRKLNAQMAVKTRRANVQARMTNVRNKR